MKNSLVLLLSGTFAACAAASVAANAQSGLVLPKSIEAGSAFSIPTTGGGKATLYIVGPGQVLKEDVELGETASFPAGTIYNSGDYATFLLTGSLTESGVFSVVPAAPATLSFLAKPSRLPVSLHDGITGAVYVFDAYHNLIVKPMPVSFELTTASGAVQKRSVPTVDGAAWTELDSTPQEGADKFAARLGDISTTRIVRQVPGDPCGLKISAKEAGQKVDLSTEPVRDCSGNAVPDGTIVTFTESYHGGQATVDVPLKRDIAEIQMPFHSGATITVASGVVMGNQIGLGK
jgi:hypothetical protein